MRPGSNTKQRWQRGLPAIVLAAGLSVLTARGETGSEAGALQDWAALIEANGPRMPGSPGNRALEDAVRERFAASGYATGTLTFVAPVLDAGHVEVTLDTVGSTYRLEALHPSLMRPGNFPEPRVEAPLVYLGRGTVDDLARIAGLDLKGAVGVMEFDSNDRWMDMLRFGLRGLIFLSAETYTHADAVTKVYNSEVAVPRYFADEAATTALRARFGGDGGPVAATLHETPSRWRRATLGSPWVLIPGSDPDAARDTLLLTAPLDANSVVPARAYGGDSAGNLMLLLNLLDRWAQTPPQRSVLLVAVNAHTQNYLGERLLAWHLLQARDDVTRLRDNLAREMRVASVFADHYRQLRLDPVPGMDAETIHDRFNIMWALYGEAEPGDPATLDDAALRAGIDGAIDGLDERMGSLGARLFMTAEARVHELESRRRLEVLREGDFADLRAGLSAAREAFRDEQILDVWRDKMDMSTGRRVIVKSRFQNRIQRNLNMTKLSQMDLVRDGITDEHIIRDLAREREVLTQLLVLFNKLDIGYGRERVRYRQIVADDEARALLASTRDALVQELDEQISLFRERLEMDTASGELRDALGTRRVRLAITLGMDWTAGEAGLMALNRLPRRDWYRRFGDLAVQVAEALPAGGPAVYVDTLSTAIGRPQDGYFFDHASPAGLFHAADGTPSLALRAIGSAPVRAFAPRNRIADLDAEAVRRRFNRLGDFLVALLDAPGLGGADVLPRLPVPGAFRLWSTLVRTFEMDEFAAQPTPSLPVRDAVVTAYSRDDATDVLPSVIDGQVAHVNAALGDATGFAILYGLSESTYAPTAYQLDPDRQARVLATIDKGRIQQARQIESNLHRTPSKTLPMFRCGEFVIRDRLDPSRMGRRPVRVDEFWIFSGLSSAQPQKYGIHGAGSLSRAFSHRASGPVGVYQEYRLRTDAGEPLMMMTLNRRFAVNPTEEAPEGQGFESDVVLGHDFFLQAARDMYAVTLTRLEGMTGVVNELVDEFLARGRESLDAAAEAEAAGDYVRLRRRAAIALGNIAKAYSQIRDMNADMLKAIMIYMALMLPFCYFLQKLIFSFTRIEHEMLAFAGMFVVTYMGFRLIHPAFAIAMSPEAIFLAFVLGTVGVFVTAVLQSRFSAEMDLLFRGSGGFAGETSTAFVGQTAMIIGVNNMKRRRTRTTLTTATIVLVVFTMLAFSSVSRKARPTLIQQSDTAAYSGMLFGWPDGSAMDEGTLRVFEILYGDRADVLARRVLRPAPTPDGYAVRWRVAHADGPERDVAVSALMSLSADESLFSGSIGFALGGGFSAPDAAEAVLPASMAEALELHAADMGHVRVRLLGRELTVTGVIDEDRYRGLRDLDPRMPLLPGSVIGGEDAAEGMARETGAALAQDMATLVFLPPDLLRQLGGRPYTVSVRFREADMLADQHAIWREADRLLRATDAMFVMGSVAPFMVGEDSRRTTDAGVYRVVGAYRTTIGGLARLIVPLMIAGLILFNTMLSTVYERKAEIAIYNAVGLNPKHIFIFFLAEALVYGVIGSIGGYLIGQILATVAQHLDLVRGMNVNFSSLMVVWAIIFTIGLVLLSTLYPAWVATRTAVPSGTRRWGLPEHDGTRMAVDLPFIYEPELAIGAMAYLHDLFSRCVEGSMSEMLVDVRKLETDRAEAHPVLRAEYGVALAPFDLGVTQSLQIESRFVDDLESYSMRLDIRRESGQDTSWATVNQPMLERLRKALLRWRNMDPARHQEYVNLGRKLFEV